MATLPTDTVTAVVIGGGQAGLATSYHLAHHGIDHVVLDDNDRMGAAWRNRWDSMRLFTPGRFNSLPGMAFPAAARTEPNKQELADYLEAYATRFDLPVHTGMHVDRLSTVGTGYVIESGDQRMRARHVVVATGCFHHPTVPAFASALDDAIVQLHSSDYRRPSQLAGGDVLVVGAGASGAQIAMELAEGHRVWLSGRDPGQEPPLPAFVLAFLADRVLQVTNPIGRKVRDHFLQTPRGIPRARVTRRDLRAAGIEWVGRTSGTSRGRPRLDDGRVLDVANVVWATGYRPDFGWIDIPVFGDDGLPVHELGVVECQPGLYFMGLPFQRSLSSALVLGVGRDAAHVAAHIASRNRAHEDAPGRPSGQVRATTS